MNNRDFHFDNFLLNPSLMPQVTWPGLVFNTTALHHTNNLNIVA